ncbi:uncharacterized protein LOC144175114 [Haemaphysalis longicornis]
MPPLTQHRFSTRSACPRALSTKVKAAGILAAVFALCLLLLSGRHGRLRPAVQDLENGMQMDTIPLLRRAGRGDVNKATYEAVLSRSLTKQPSMSVDEPTSSQVELTYKRFIIDTPSCKIPKIDLFDLSIAHHVSKMERIDCSKDFPNLTFTKGDRIYINDHVLPQALNKTPVLGIHCCYRPFFRTTKLQSDNDNEFLNSSLPLLNGQKMPYEFIKVECFNGGTLFYANYHAFVHPKPSYQRRFNESFKPENPGYQYSVLIVGVDGVSRLNAHRQFPETVRFLKERMGAVEMHGYTKVGDNTFPNLVPLLTGLTEQELAFGIWSENDFLDSLPIIWKSFAANGWSTFYAEDNPEISTFSYLKQGFLEQPTDFYFRPFMRAYELDFGHRQTENCHLCVGAQSETEVLLEWLRSYTQMIVNWPSFAFAWLNSATHDDFNGGSQVDHLHKLFFESLHQDAYLDNTIVLFLSDHGYRWDPVRTTYAGMLEDRLPALFISFPPTFRRHHPEIMRNIHINSRRLITPFDLHTTLASLVNFDGKPRPLDLDSYPDHHHGPIVERAVNLFGEVPLNRSCEDASIDEQWCTCRPTIAEDPKSEGVLLAATMLINHINRMTDAYRVLCAPLTVAAVESARVLVRSSLANATEYVLQVKTSPGEALFEATVRLHSDGHPAHLLGDISRLNLYRGQADCVESASIKKFCFCVSQVTNMVPAP